MKLSSTSETLQPPAFHCDLASLILFKETVTETEDESLDNLSSPFSSGNNPKLSTFGSISGGITSPTRAPTTKTTAGPPPPSSVTDSSSRSRSSVSEVKDKIEF